ncbi:MAG: hypothetical protein D6748_08660 [Calditrichaeota bacterium]|nr:MAG: hypothetical protein D6748_08660 [Calditrichota bacterium]
MEYTFKELKKKTVAELREIASGIEHEAVQGYTQMNKEHLLEAICKALNIDTHEHHVAQGIDKTSIKAKIKELKKERDSAIEAKDYPKLKAVRKEIKALKKQLRKAMV